MSDPIHEEYRNSLKQYIENRLNEINAAFNLPEGFGMRLERLTSDGNITLPSYTVMISSGWKDADGRGGLIEHHIDIGAQNDVGGADQSSLEWSRIAEPVESFAHMRAIATGRDIELHRYGGDIENRPLWSYSGNAMVRSAVKSAGITTGSELERWADSDTRSGWGPRVTIDQHPNYTNPLEAGEDGRARFTVKDLPETIVTSLQARNGRKMMLGELVHLDDPRDMEIERIGRWDGDPEIDILFKDPVVRLHDAPDSIANEDPEETWLAIMRVHEGPLPYKRQSKE